MLRKRAGKGLHPEIPSSSPLLSPPLFLQQLSHTLLWRAPPATGHQHSLCGDAGGHRGRATGTCHVAHGTWHMACDRASASPVWEPQHLYRDAALPAIYLGDRQQSPPCPDDAAMASCFAKQRPLSAPAGLPLTVQHLAWGRKRVCSPFDGLLRAAHLPSTSCPRAVRTPLQQCCHGHCRARGVEINDLPTTTHGRRVSIQNSSASSQPSPKQSLCLSRYIRTILHQQSFKPVRFISFRFSSEILSS